MSTPMVATREALGDMPNPLGLQGIEFIEYATSRPQALGQALERMGFQPVARHRSREVLLYSQGDMNIIVNAHQDTERTGVHAPPALTETPVLAAIAFRVGNAAAAVRRVVQYIGLGRAADWIHFYAELFGFAELAPDQSFGVLTHGRILASPCGTLHWQLIEPLVDALDADPEELLQRVAFGTPDVLATVQALRARGVEFVESPTGAHTGTRGAITRADTASPSS